MHNPKTYRDRAVQALLKAQAATEPLRTTFEALAAGYEVLAVDAERLGEDAQADAVNLRQTGQSPLRSERANFTEASNVGTR